MLCVCVFVCVCLFECARVCLFELCARDMYCSARHGRSSRVACQTYSGLKTRVAPVLARASLHHIAACHSNCEDEREDEHVTTIMMRSPR